MQMGRNCVSCLGLGPLREMECLLNAAILASGRASV
jgi:hypothetical protein